jgi:hypothetical protein
MARAANEQIQVEREWRELLIKRLSTVRSTLKRDAAEEQKLIRRTIEIAARYPNETEAHEAFGWGEITEKEYRRSVELLGQSPAETSRSTKALVRLNWMIESLAGELKMIYEGDEMEVVPALQGELPTQPEGK